MKSFFKYTAATIIGILITMIIVVVISFSFTASISKEDTVEIKPNTVLHLNFDKSMYDKAPSDIQSSFAGGEKPLGLNTVLENINKATRDENISGIFIETQTFGGGIAMAEEVREALLKFKKDAPNKFIVTYSKSLSITAYYLATVSDRIYLNPSGNLDFKGLSASVIFFKNLLDNLDVEVQVFRPEGCKFKSAVEPYILDKMSEANREQMSKYIQGTWDIIVDGIAKERNITEEELNRIADNLLITNAQDAKDYNLIDFVGHYDEAVAYMKQLTQTKEDKKLATVSINNYKNVEIDDDKEFTKDRIAVIYAQGQIVDGKGNDTKIGDQTLIKSIRSAREDKNVKAVVLRVNSPGGSALASEVILREIELTQKEKPVIASFGATAASGGYYISCKCDKIICNPLCVTGSIGVFGMIPNAQKLLNEKIGITTDIVTTNRNSNELNILEGMTPEMKQFWNKQVDDIYTTFIGHVSEGRDLTTARVDEIGQGRVWLGPDAIDIKLVDKLGGLETAITEAAAIAELDNYQITTFPKQKDALTMLMEMLQGEESINIKHSDLGMLFAPYQALKYLVEMEGVQARLPFIYQMEN